METKATEDLLSRIDELEGRLAEAEQLIEAIKAGEVDAFAFNRNNQPEIYTLQSGDYAYRVLVENFGEGALNLSEEGLIVYTNNYFSELLGLSYETVIGVPVFNFIHPGSKKMFTDLFKKGLAGQSKGEINLVSGDKIIPVYVSLTSLYPNLPTVGMIVTDLSEKKQHEKELQAKNLFIETIIESSHELIAVYDCDRKLISMNRASEQYIGGAQAATHRQRTFRDTWGRKGTRTEADLEKALRGEFVENEPHLSFVTGRYIQNYLTPLKDKDGEIYAALVIAHDVTDIKNASRQLEEKIIELNRSNTELASFSYIASHDLQEPLRKIQTFATRIIEKEQALLSDNGRMMFGRMQLAAKRMQNLIDDLLAYSRTNTAEPRFERVQLAKIIDEVKNDLKEELKEKNGVLEYDKMCDADILPFQLRQLLHNLIGNSLKFAVPGRPPHIKIESRIVRGSELKNQKLSPDQDYCHISISDNGIGFEPQYNEKIFDLFQRLHGREEYSGTGIGLSIVKRIVENHKGVITATGEINKGARFDVFLPSLG